MGQLIKRSDDEQLFAHLHTAVAVTSGELWCQSKKRRVAPLSIEVPDTDGEKINYFIKLKDQNKKDVLAVYIPSGQTFKAKAPLGTYDLIYASGETWFGEERLFGPSTMISKQIIHSVLITQVATLLAEAFDLFVYLRASHQKQACQ